MWTLVVGSTGLVGSNVTSRFADHDHEVLGTSRSAEEADVTLDKTDDEQVRAVIEEFDPEIIVDTAAFHSVDDCETRRDRAWTVNATGTRNVAAAANAVGAHLVYFSTDYVFEGSPEDAPYSEDDPIRPVNYYGESKYGAEQAAKIADRSTVLRPSVIYGSASSNFATWVLGELRDGNEIDIVDDQVSRPTYAPDLARACLAIAEDGITGLYHATGPESLSRYEFTATLAETYGFDVDLVSPISSEELGQSARRPEDSSLESTRLYDAVGYEFLDPHDALRTMLNAGG